MTREQKIQAFRTITAHAIQGLLASGHYTADDANGPYLVYVKKHGSESCQVVKDALEIALTAVDEIEQMEDFIEESESPNP